MQSGLAVIRAKVGIPPLAETRVARPRVERVLADLIERHRTVVVSATAGAGKTTAVADAARTLGRPLAWLTLDSTDSAPGRLVTYLEAALAAALPRVGGVATEGLAARSRTRRSSACSPRPRQASGWSSCLTSSSR